ncbi:MAG TPA: hypothetical protein PKY28_07340 [Ferruginibacter sp.]|nr:hypothetical protein [Ferruginibacter sp.]
MATSKRTAIDTLYFVNATNRKVSLEVITGSIGQTSKMTINLDGADIIKNHPGIFPETVIGANNELEGKVLTIVCTIADTSRDTNMTEMRIRLNGGIIFMEFPLFAIVENEGDSVNYTCFFTFFKP